MEKFGPTNAVAVVGMAFLQQEYPTMAWKVSTKILFLTMFLTAYLVFSCYSATLTSVLMIGYNPSPIKDLSDVLRLRFYPTAMKGTAYADVFIQVFLY